MCGGGSPKPPAVADPAAERLQAAADAQAAANAQTIADKRRKRAQGGLLSDFVPAVTTLGGGAPAAATVLGGSRFGQAI